MIYLDYNDFIGKSVSTKGDTKYVPKMRLNEGKFDSIKNLIPNFPVNKEIPFKKELLITCIQYGMILLINYKGDEDKWKGGRNRVILPMVIGVNKNTGNLLIRGFHMEGYSVSQKKETKKVWRLFKASNIKSMMFTGEFYRMPPAGYKQNDKIMTEVLIKSADFNEIRRNQNKLLEIGKIEASDKTTLGDKQSITQIETKNTGTKLNLKDPWTNKFLDKNDAKNIKISILKPIYNTDTGIIAVIGAIGTIGRSVVVFEERKKLGTYQTIDTFMGSEFGKKRFVNNEFEFDMYTFVKKI